MAKNSIRDYSATNSSNTDIQSIDISEGCSPAGINNAIREVMADLKDVSTGAVALESPAADSLSVTGDLTVDTNTLYVDSTNNRVGIGTSSPDNKVNIQESALSGRGASNGNTSMTLEHATDTGIQFFSATQTQLRFGDAADTGAGSIIYEHATDKLRLNTGALMTFEDGGVERMRIDSSGGLLVGGTSTGNNNRVTIAATWPKNPLELTVSSTSPTASAAQFYYNGGFTGQIQLSSGSTAYLTSSDYRLKENVVADWDATTRLKQLNPVRFNFIADADTTVDGFLAHEVQSVVPEAISGTKDAMRDEEYQVSAATGDIYTPAIEAVLDEDGNEVTPAVAEVIHSTDVERPEELAEGQQWRETTAAVMGTRSVPDYQGIDQSKLVPLLVKTIQELEARITALEAS